ncbi:uncharacterized protein LOC144918678 [Branchiostoma floridae x Branchiostoma belcheri]
MAGFPYSSVRGLGGVQIFLGLAAMGLGGGDLALSLSRRRYFGSRFELHMLCTGIWTGLFFLIAGSLAASIRQGSTAGCKIGAAQTMSLLNTFIFAPGLASVSAISAVQNYWDWFYGIREYYYPYDYYHPPEIRMMFFLESTIAVVGGLEFIFSIATASVCCCGGSYDQPATNQVVPMPMMAFPTPIQQPAVPAPVARPSLGFAQMPRTSVPAGAATGGDGQMVTLPAAELGMLYAKANNSAAEE